jgi:hypothetical protein
MSEDAGGVVRRLQQAVNAHDLEAVTRCFAPDYRNETPAHPGRGFLGQNQVSKNWERIFSAVPDVTARVLSSAIAEDAVWSEWEMAGTRSDGGEHLMRGVIIFDVRGDHITRARFYLEPVDAGAEGVDAAIGQLVGEKPGRP